MLHAEMSYKQLVKSQGPIIARYRIIRAAIVARKSCTRIAQYFCLHRNSVSNILALYKKHTTQETTAFFASVTHATQEQIESLFSFLLPASRKPHHFRATAPPAVEKLVCKEFNLL
jgi:hypothetical protein